MAAGALDRGDDELADLRTELLEFVIRERLEVGGRFNRRQNHSASLVLRPRRAPGKFPTLPLIVNDEKDVSTWQVAACWRCDRLLYFGLWPYSSGVSSS